MQRKGQKIDQKKFKENEVQKMVSAEGKKKYMYYICLNLSEKYHIGTIVFIQNFILKQQKDKK